jgi:hypothetical protein
MGPSPRRVAQRGFRGILFLGPLLGGVLSVLVLPGLASSANIRVPEDQPTLQAAVRAAHSGDVILFAPGTYAGGAFVNNKYLIFDSWYRFTGDTSYIARTVLTGVASGACGGQPGCAGNAVLEFGPNAGNSRITGLTLTHGENGVAASSRVSIINCHVIGNGDGVDYVSGAGGAFLNSLFAGNSDDGIDLNGDMDLTIANNEIRDNGDDGIEYRLFAYQGPMRTVTVTGNRITGNGEDGIQLIDYASVDSFVVRIERNLFRANFDASGSSAAIGCMASGNTVENLSGAPVAERVYVMHNTFLGEKNGLVGGANTIALNNLFTGIQNRAVRRVGGKSITAWSLFWNNLVNYETSVLDSATLRVADPKVDSTGHLMAGSAAIAAGTRSYFWKGETVVNDPPGSSIDLGAYPFTPNRRPVVKLGSDRLVRLPASIRLAAQVSDDGRPVPEGMLAFQWSVLSGPAPVSLDTPNLAATTATFTTAGLYQVRFAASDGELTGADTIGVAVQQLLGLGDFPVRAAADDAEEQTNGLLSASVSDLELVFSGGNQVVGLRFPAVAIPSGVAITHAYIQFVSDGIQSEPTNLLLQGQADDNPGPFVAQLHNISGRPRTAASVSWVPPPWTVMGEAGSNQRTADLTRVIQEIIGRPGWRSGNAIVVIVSGSGHRTAKSYERDPAGVAVLHIEFEPQAVAVGSEPPADLDLRTIGATVAAGAVEVEFALPAAGPARLELVDLAGRRLAAQEVGAMGIGRHRASLARDLPAGVYFVRLTQDRRSRVVKTVALR